MFPSGICSFQALQISVGSPKTAAGTALLNPSKGLPLMSLLHQFQKHLDEEMAGGGGSTCYMQTSQNIQSLRISL